MSKKTKKRDSAPNQIVGVIIETVWWRSHFPHVGVQSSMTVRWETGMTSKMPMPIIAKPGDRFVFTITPA